MQFYKKEVRRGFLFLLFVFVFTMLIGLSLDWDEFYDPAFIPNARFAFIEFKLLPILTVLIIYILLKKYRNNNDVKSQFFTGSKLVKGFLFLMYPCLIYMSLWSLSIVPIKYMAVHRLGEIWSKEYLLTSIGVCCSDYGNQCIKLNLLDLSTKKNYSIRWYLDTKELQTLKNKKINLVGEKSYFGYLVNEIQW